MSPYAYTANNPIKFTDPDGRDWGIKKTVDKNGNITYNITLDIVSINSSSSKVDMGKFNDRFKKQVERTFSGSYDKDKSRITIKTTVNISTIDKKSDRKSSDHLLEIKNNSDPGMSDLYGKANKIGGKEIYVNDSKVQGMMDGSDNNTLPHETGHTSGLYHPDVEQSNAPAGTLFRPQEDGTDRFNVMYSGGPSSFLDDERSIELNKAQFEAIVDNIENNKVNKE